MNQLLILPRELIYLKVLSSEFMKHYEVARNKMLDENPKKTYGGFFPSTIRLLSTAVRSQSSVDNSVT